MASTFKNLSPNDKISTKTLLHEAIPLTGTILSGTYSENNIKNYSHGMFQSVYDYPFLSSSANHIFDISFGYSSDSGARAATTLAAAQKAKKTNLYNQMAQVLVGYDITGSIQQFDEDGDLADGTKLKENIFLSFSRLLVKDEIKRGSFQMTLAVGAPSTQKNYQSSTTGSIVVKDFNAVNSYKINSPVGEYGILYATGSAISGSGKLGTGIYATHAPCGLIYYQAGVVVLSGSVFMPSGSGGLVFLSATASSGNFLNSGHGPASFHGALTGSSITTLADNVRSRIQNIQFNNTVELNSSIYFCRINHNEFNYSANPSYLTGSQIRVKSKASDMPVSYITTVGLYSARNELLAVGKLSEPLRKDPTIEYTLRARLDY
tara:strand:+ start:3285 stop:4415 length:1131 start_codon:yes stop_codon:yes gene_type:complete